MLHSMDCIENGIHKTNDNLQKYTKVFRCIMILERLKCILTDLHCIRYNEINIGHSDIIKSYNFF